MNKKNYGKELFGFSLIILTLIVAIILGFMAGPASPLTWLLLIALIAIPFLYRKIAAKDFIVWKDEYSVGIKSIDQQHKKLIHLINQLKTAVKYSTGEEFEREALDEVVRYTKTHFSYEEDILQQNGYPDFEAHKAQHEKMIARVNEVLAEYEKNSDSAMENALSYLSEWLINHINGTDKEYSHFMISRGVK